VDGFTVMEVKVAVLTVKEVDPLTAPAVAEIAVIPVATLVARP
jgi:hypothetical protein